jgi:transmembrane sensor
MQHQAFITLLSKRLSGEITREQLEQLNQWLAQDIEHQRMADAYQFIWDRAEGVTFEDSLSPNLDQAFAKVMHKQVQRPAVANPIFNIAFFGKLARVAAALAFLAVAVWGVQRLVNPQQSAMLEIKVEQGDKREFTLPDGSVVWLRAGSILRYPREFGRDSRCVDLVGEAFFEVHHNPQAPFCVNTSRNERIEVLGTSFDIKETAENTSVLVKTGKVRFSTPNNSSHAIVTAGRIANFDRNAAKVTVSDVTSFNDLVWQMGHLEFVNAPIEQVVKDFEDHFNIHIEMENTELLQCRYTSTKVPDDVQKALEMFKTTFKLELISTSSEKFIFKGGTCL